MSISETLFVCTAAGCMIAMAWIVLVMCVCEIFGIYPNRRVTVVAFIPLVASMLLAVLAALSGVIALLK